MRLAELRLSSASSLATWAGVGIRVLVAKEAKDGTCDLVCERAKGAGPSPHGIMMLPPQQTTAALSSAVLRCHQIRHATAHAISGDADAVLLRPPEDH